MPAPPIALQEHTSEGLCRQVPGLREGEARKLLASVHRDELLEPRPGLSRRAVDLVASRAASRPPTLELLARDDSQVDGFSRLLLATADGHRIESVVMPLERAGRVSLCVSSQAGCALACAFCATGRLGLGRNLEAWEMVEQARIARRGLSPGTRLHGVVFQGMGEPLANFERVKRAIEVMTAPYALAIDARAITVSTAGLPHGIRRLAREAPRVRLALSIGSARPEVRERLMPISRTHPLGDVLEAAIDHACATGLAPLWAVTLLGGVNDTDADAEALALTAAGFRRRTGRTPRVSIIAYNPIDVAGRDPFRQTDADRTAAFRDRLAELGLRSHRRYSGGADISAACGQLAGQPS